MKRLLCIALCLWPAIALATDKLSIVDLRPYDQENWPKLFARYGSDIVLGEIQDLRVKGAQAAAELPNCDMVGISDYSETRSKPGYPAVHVDCENGYRIYFNYKGIIERESY